MEKWISKSHQVMKMKKATENLLLVKGRAIKSFSQEEVKEIPIITVDLKTLADPVCPEL